ncbi:STAS domain-containing protein [Catellatospora sp. NPDC049609]|uniref:STAS domain-containing protein n=1 Tax=Catellatospora sp. NPDC049609 TaxID=3155505 RepID=UPI003415D480
MAEDLALRQGGQPRLVHITAAGALHVDNAHRLPKFLVALLRTRPVAAVRLDLRGVGRVDDVGVAAIVLCGREAARRGIAFAIDGCSRAVAAAIRDYGAGHLLPARPRRGMALRRPHTGIACRAETRPPRGGPRPRGDRPPWTDAGQWPCRWR